MSALPSEIVAPPSNRKDWRHKPHPHMERFVAIAAYLMQMPRSQRELAWRLGITYTGNNLGALLGVMLEKGVIHISGWKHTGPNAACKLVPVYAWQTVPFAQPDEPKPRKKRIRRRAAANDALAVA